MKSFIEIFNVGGIPLIIVAAFLYFLQWQGKYFMKQINSHVEERKDIITTFGLMLSNHCHTVTDALNKQTVAMEKQDETFRLLVTQIEIFNGLMEKK